MLLGFVIGFLTGAFTIWLYSVAKMSRIKGKRRKESRRKHNRPAKAYELSNKQRIQSFEQKPLECAGKLHALNPAKDAAEVSVQKTERPSQLEENGKTSLQTKSKPDRTAGLYHNFGVEKQLKLVFSESFASSAYFTNGKGYLINEAMELLPAEQLFRRNNSIRNYLASGLFWVFDIMYRGKQYSFEQIKDGMLDNGYVTILGCLRSATVRETADQNTYTLYEKGLLEIADQ